MESYLWYKNNFLQQQYIFATIKKGGNVHLNVTAMHVRVTIFVVEKQ
jgi:hypothetical protein